MVIVGLTFWSNVKILSAVVMLDEALSKQKNRNTVLSPFNDRACQLPPAPLIEIVPTARALLANVIKESFMI